MNQQELLNTHMTKFFSLWCAKKTSTMTPESLNETWNTIKNQKAISSIFSKKNKPKKDANKTKKPQSAYLLFCADNRPKYKDLTAKEILSQLGKDWQELKLATDSKSVELLKQYNLKSDNEKNHYTQGKTVVDEPKETVEVPEVKEVPKKKVPIQPPVLFSKKRQSRTKNLEI